MRKVPLTLVANLYPSTDKPYFGTFIKNIYESLDENLFDKEKLVLPEFGEGFKGYLKFYFSTFFNFLEDK